MEIKEIEGKIVALRKECQEIKREMGMVKKEMERIKGLLEG